MPNRARQIIPFPNAHHKAVVRPKRGKKRRWTLALVCLAMVVFVVCAGAQWVRQESRMRALNVQYEGLLKQQQELQADNELLQQQIDRVLQDPNYLEQLARQMGLVKPDDVIYLTIDPAP